MVQNMEQNFMESDSEEYLTTELQREIIIKRLRERGCRITKQRRILLDIILDGECACCKEIYYKASKIDRGIGSATVYRMINTLEEIGAISRKNMYKVACGKECAVENACMIQLKDNTEVELSASEWNQVIRCGLVACGYSSGQEVKSVIAMPCACTQCAV